MAFQINDQYGIGHNSNKRKVRAPDPSKGAGDQFDEARVLISENGKERNQQLASWLKMIYEADTTSNEKLVGGLIVGASNSCRRRCFLKIKEIAELLNIGESSVRRAISGLSKKAFICSTNQRPGEDGTPEKADRKVKWHVPNLELLEAGKEAGKEFKSMVFLLTTIVAENGKIQEENLDKITHELALKMSGNDDKLTAQNERKLDELMIFLRSNWEGLPLKMSASTAQNERKSEGESLYKYKVKRSYKKIHIDNTELEESLEKNQNKKVEEICNSKAGNESGEKIEIYQPENTTILHGQTATNSELELSTPNHPPLAPLQSGELALEGGENFFEGYSMTFPLTDRRKVQNAMLLAEREGFTQDQFIELVLKHDVWLSGQSENFWRTKKPHESLQKWIMDDKNFRPASNYPVQNAGGNQLQAPTDPREVEKAKISLKLQIKNSKGLNVFTGVEACELIDKYDGLSALEARDYLQKSENFDEAKERIVVDRHRAKHGLPKEMFEGDILWEHHNTNNLDEKRHIGFYRKSVMNKILEEMPELENYEDDGGFTGIKPIIRDFDHQYLEDELRQGTLWKLWFSDVNEPQKVFDELFFNFCKERHQKMPKENQSR